MRYGYENGGRDVLCKRLVPNSEVAVTDIQICRFFSPGNDVSFLCMLKPTGLLKRICRTRFLLIGGE